MERRGEGECENGLRWLGERERESRRAVVSCSGGEKDWRLRVSALRSGAKKRGRQEGAKEGRKGRHEWI